MTTTEAKKEFDKVRSEWQQEFKANGATARWHELEAKKTELFQVMRKAYLVGRAGK